MSRLRQYTLGLFVAIGIGTVSIPGGALASGPTGALPTAGPSFNTCPDRGTWPGPNGPHWLNQFADGNCYYYIDVHYLGSLTMDTGTWYQQDVLNINQGATVTIAPNVILLDSYYAQPNHLGGYINVNGALDFEAGSQFQVQCVPCGIFVGWLSSGNLTVNGTASAPVTMSGPTAGSWMGVAFRSAGSQATTGNVNYLHLSGAGAYDGTFNVQAGIFITDSSPVILNSSIEKSAGNGIQIGSAVSAPVLNYDSLVSNTGYAIQYDFLSSTLTNIVNPSMYGNGRDAVRMVNATASQYTGEVMWPNLGYPIIDDVFTTVLHGGHLTIAPGTTVQFGKQSALQADNGGTITMNGTQAARITLTSEAASPAAGDWGALELLGTSVASLNYLHVSYAGAPAAGFPSIRAAVLIRTANVTALSNTIIDHSAGNDVDISSGAPPLLRSNSFLPVPCSFYGVDNRGSVTVDAQQNWWGDPTGPGSVVPCGPSAQVIPTPTGKGTPVSANVDYTNWLLAAPGGPTVSRANRFWYHRHGADIVFRWRMSRRPSVAGFNVYAGQHRLNRSPVPTRTDGSYRFVARWTDATAFRLELILRNGQTVTISRA